MKVKRPVLRWHGGKWKLSPWIISFFPEHRMYVEPFGGAGSVLIRKPRSKGEVYNDVDGEVVDLFHILRDKKDAQKLKELVTMTPFARQELDRAYAPTKSRFEKARRLLVRSYMAFGTDGHNKKVVCGFRTRRIAAGTTPATDWKNWPAAVAALTERLRGVVIENRPAERIISDYDSGDSLIYADPPYVPSSRKRVDAGRGYSHEMDNDGHIKLAEDLNQVKGKVILSGYHSELYDDLYAGWHQEERKHLADGGGKRIEVLWMNFKPEGRLL